MNKSGKNEFFGENIIFENHWKEITKYEINLYVVETFLGKEDFIKFYLEHNGGYFTDVVGFITNYPLAKELGYNEMGISSFNHIPLPNEELNSNSFTFSIAKARDTLPKTNLDGFDNFLVHHIPFANDEENDYFIDIRTGEIKYMDYETMEFNESIIVASSFKDFCKRIKKVL
jgi:hypothetical protein